MRKFVFQFLLLSLLGSTAYSEDLGPWFRLRPILEPPPAIKWVRKTPYNFLSREHVVDDEMRAEFAAEDKRKGRAGLLRHVVLSYLNRDDIKAAQDTIDKKIVYRGEEVFRTYLLAQTEVYLYQKDYKRAYEFLEPHCSRLMSDDLKAYLAYAAIRLGIKPTGLEEYMKSVSEFGTVRSKPADKEYALERFCHYFVDLTLTRYLADFFVPAIYEDWGNQDPFVRQSYLRYLYFHGQYETAFAFGTKFADEAYRNKNADLSRDFRNYVKSFKGRKNQPWPRPPIPSVDLDGA